MSKEFSFFVNSFSDELIADEFFNATCDLRVFSGHSTLFDFSSRMCKLGDSFVSLTVSRTGWGYESHAEVDGFLVIVPETGKIKWDTYKDKYRANEGQLFAIDHREVNGASYEPHSRHASIFLSHTELFRYLSLLVGENPRSRLHLVENTAGNVEARCFVELVKTIIFLSSNTSSGINRSIGHLKECLINFWLHNISHNYSRELREPGSMRKLAPHSVNLVAEYILINFDKDLTVSQLAISAGVSIRALQLGFKKFKNTTPIRYLRSIRLQKARAMLMDENLELTPQEVSEKCGFSNYYFFCKHYHFEFLEKPVNTKNKIILSATAG